jgi:uncharacterized protein
MRDRDARERYGIAERSFCLIVSALRARPEIERAMIFGSRAMGTAKHGSDIDIAIEGANVTRHLADELSLELNERLPIPYYVDVVAYNTTDHPGLREHIATHGHELYSRDHE